MKQTQELQLAFAGYLRDPRTQPLTPANAMPMEERRLSIYRDLVFNNIAGFIAGAFPVIKQILPDDHWQQLVRDFLIEHRAQTPYFLEISQEFLRYLEVRGQRAGDPPFLVELAHYEWIELALDVADVALPPPKSPLVSVLSDAQRLWVSPLAWSLVYRFPVHRLGPDFQPGQPDATPIFLLAYRNRRDQIAFMALNALSYALLQLLENAPGLTFGECVEQMREMGLGYTDTREIEEARSLVTDWLAKDVLIDRQINSD